MKDNKLKSLTESILNILIWFIIAYISNLIVLPMFWYNVTAEDWFWIAIVFTIISLVRSYIIRRLFVNWIYETLFIKKK
jgi:hypothetical protein